MNSREQCLSEQQLLTLFTAVWWVDACMTSYDNPPESAGFFLGISNQLGRHLLMARDLAKNIGI
jgi:hypothetical protein